MTLFNIRVSKHVSRLYFFKYQPEVIHRFILKANFIRTYFKHFHLVPEFFIKNYFWNKSNHRANAMLGQPGRDKFFGNGGEDVIDARDGGRDDWIQCGLGHPAVPGKKATKSRRAIPPRLATGRPEGRALIDRSDPYPFNCATVVHGTPVPGLNG